MKRKKKSKPETQPRKLSRGRAVSTNHRDSTDRQGSTCDERSRCSRGSAVRRKMMAAPTGQCGASWCSVVCDYEPVSANRMFQELEQMQPRKTKSNSSLPGPRSLRLNSNLV